MTSNTITIASRFNGPPGSGNGGYVCGLLAREIEGPSEATLRAPPPLETPLTLERHDGSVRLMHGETVIAEARPATLDLVAPPAPTRDAAEAARARYRGLLNHRYPTCFVCGNRRPAHDGLDIFTGPVEGADMVAAPWTPTADLAGENGRIAPEFVHAALDCPSYWALPRAGDMAALLARLAASIDGDLPRVGESCIIAAWPIASDGRKHRGASALYGEDGRLIARAEALWIEPRQAG
jgi:hypothetical protein